MDRDGLYVCYTMDVSPVKLLNHFMRVHDVMAVFADAKSILCGRSKLQREPLIPVFAN